MLWECVGDLKPGGFGSHKGVFSGAHTRVGIERSQRYFAQFSVHGNTEAGPTDSAEGPTNIWRSLVNGQKIVARQPTKVSDANFCVGCKGRPMKSSAHRAMAVAHVGKWPIHFVTHRTAKTTALNFHAAVSSVAQRSRSGAPSEFFERGDPGMRSKCRGGARSAW